MSTDTTTGPFVRQIDLESTEHDAGRPIVMVEALSQNGDEGISISDIHFDRGWSRYCAGFDPDCNCAVVCWKKEWISHV